MSTAAELLALLPRHFESVAPTLRAAERARSFASGLLRLSEEQRWSGVRSGSPALKQQLLVAARVLTDFTAAATRHAASGVFPAALVTQIIACLRASTSCALLACTLEQLDPQAAFTICAPCSLVFGIGSAMLAPAVQMQPQHIAFKLCMAQLGAAAVAVADLLQPSRQPRAAAAFANSTAKPQALVAWLGELCKALLCFKEGITREGHTAVGVSLVALLHMLLTTEPYARHRDVLADSPALQQAVADALLVHGVGGLPAALEADWSHASIYTDTLRCLTGVLQHRVLAAAVVQRLHTADAVAAVRHVAAVIEALPVPRPAGMPADLFLRVHGHALLLLNICCQRQVGRLRADGSIAVDYGAGCSSCAQPGSGGGSSDGSCAEPSSSSSGASHGSSVSGGKQGSGADHRQVSAWQLVALVPRLAAALGALADDPEGEAAFSADDWLVTVEGACANFATALILLAVLQGQPASAEQLTSWAAAATAGLRLQPLLLRLDARLRESPWRLADVRPPDGAARLSALLMTHLWHRIPVTPQPATWSQEECAQLADSLTELHSVACRLAHWTVSRGSAALAGTDAAAAPLRHWAEQLRLLTNFFEAMMSARVACYAANGQARLANPKEDDAPYDLQWACAAHLQAVLAVAGAAAGSAGAAEDERWAAVLRRVLAVAVQHCSRYIDNAWDCAVDQAFEHVAMHAAEASGISVELASELLCPVAEAASIQPRVAAALASSALLHCMLLVAEQLASSSEEDAGGSASRLLAGWEGALLKMAAEAQQGGTSAAQYAVPDSVLAEVQAAAGALLKQHQLLLDGLPPSASLAERAERLQQLVQPAAQLGRVMMGMAHSPAVEAQRQLELARAAATRSCAYLRCANVAGQGGSAAGQGVGSARCSACRAVWYCGTACSHADWRAGHKPVCKALAAERQAAKAARAAAAAGQQQQQDAA